MSAPSIVAIVGATATGKTALSEALAERLGGEIVCADSRQVFRELELGTGKPSPELRATRPHHLFDALSLDKNAARASAGWYARAARDACEAIHARDRVPVLVGGSGLYLRAARQGLAATPPAAPAIRERLRGEGLALGAEALHLRLAAVDPPTAARLDPRDVQRITRALEVWEVSGRTLSWWHARPTEGAAKGAWRGIELMISPASLRERIASRTRSMFDSGLVEEIRALMSDGLTEALRALRAIGYDEALDLVEGRITRAEAEARTSLRTVQLAKRQRTWFRNQWKCERVEADGLGLRDLVDVALRALK